MVQSDRLSIEEIGRLWGEETGQDAADLQEDLEAWLAEAVKRGRPSSPPAKGGKTHNDNGSSDMVSDRPSSKSGSV